MPVVANPSGTLWIDVDELSEADSARTRPGIIVEPAEVPVDHTLLLTVYDTDEMPAGRAVTRALRLIRGRRRHLSVEEAFDNLGRAGRTLPEAARAIL